MEFRYSTDDDDEADIYTQNKFLEFWAKSRDSGLLDDCNLQDMNRLLDIIETPPTHTEKEWLHRNKTREMCFCQWCRDAIVFSLYRMTPTSSHAFFDDNIDDLHSIWLELDCIFPEVVNFEFFCILAERKPEN